MKTVLLGSYAVAHGARVSMVDVIAAYPITPQTSIVEKLAEFCSNKTLNAKFINVESEHSAMAACIGASTAGARAFTATSSQGLALMHELLHWAAGARLPIVLANANRALAAPWSIGADHGDSLSQRDTGWLQFYCENCQECLDTAIQAFRIGEAVLLPVMINLDGFILTHTSEPVDIPEVKENGTETILVLGLGYLFKLGKHWYFDFKGNYNFLTNAFAVNEPVNPDDPNAVYGVKGTLQYVTILAGINYRF